MLLDCVGVAGVRQHQAALQAIADANGGTRAANTPGYDDSVQYVVDTMTAAGWTVELDEFPYEVASLRQLTPTVAEYETGAYVNSALGVVTGPVIPVDINLVPPRASSSWTSPARATSPSSSAAPAGSQSRPRTQRLRAPRP
jgi:hypothetical protein